MTTDVRVPAPPSVPTTRADADGRTGAGSRRRRWWRGRSSDPVWVRSAVLVLLAATAALYLWGLGASGWANSYYSAAVQAGAKSWKAFFFGSLDSANFITVDKSPAFLWPMELSARWFGVNSGSILVPQALEGVAAVGLLYATVRRWFSPIAGLIAGGVFALTPVAALMFRFNNPDALLVLALTAGAYALTRALECGRSRWLVLAFALVGFGFLAKMLQALLVVPPFALTYLLAGPAGLGRRVRQLVVAGGAMVLAAGWWVVAVELTPSSSRPYIGGSQNNSLWNLIFGYNGFGRLTGNEAGSVGGGAPGGSRWGATGVARLFNASFGGQISWLLPAAVILLGAALLVTWRRARRDRTRAALVLWGGWLLVTGATFSLGHGIIHPYYTVALAPAIGALVGIGAVTLWRQRSVAAWYALAAAFVVTALWSYHLLARTPSWHPWLRTLVLVSGVAVGGALLIWPALARRPTRVVTAAAIVVGLLGPGAYTIATAATPHTGAIPSAGPAVGFGAGGPPGAARPRGGGAGRGFGGPAGGLLDGTTVGGELRALLSSQSSRYTWVAATVDANNAASYQLATGRPVLAVGGFNGTDPSPTLAQFVHAVAQRRIHYFVAGSSFGGAAGQSSGTAGEITTWVGDHFAARTVAGVTVYDLTAPRSASSGS